MLLKLISGLSERSNRSHAADLLAAWFNCSSLMIFITDIELGILLPAPGFPQTLPNGATWQQFTGQVADKSYYSGTLPFPNDANQVSAVGISGPENSVAILLGGTPSLEKLQPLQEIMPLLIALFKQEQHVLTATTRVTLADKSAAKAEKLATTIDQMRLHLKDALIKQAQDKKNIEELMQKKDEFMNVASHELKTPITTMKAYLQILNRKIHLGNTVSAQDFIYKASGQVEKLTALINDLLDVTKIQAGQMVYHFAEIDLSEVINEVVSQVQVTAATHRVVIRRNEPVIVYGEKHRLEQVISNLLSNAIKYSPGADQVIVSATVSESKVKVAIKDFGIGIPEDKKELVFDRFFRVQESSRQFAGLGLGLYISAEIIRRHGGAIGVESSSDGSEFYFNLPLANLSTSLSDSP